jgi:mannose-6-phosphate isomerase
MTDHRHRLVLLPANRVWRTYQGGRTLDALAGRTEPADSSFPEDWVASTTRAVNPGRESIREGPSTVEIGGRPHDLRECVAADPEYFLGAVHLGRHGPDLRLLVKLLDSAIRLHFQVHPTADFARRFLASPSGKTEAYYVLATRPEVAEPCLYLGFQRPPGRDRLRRLIETQDVAGIEACFDPVPVKPGDAFLVPGGVPHALGAGVFLVEIQEPSDLVVRFEFERGGYVLPESARFMNRGLDFCLDIFDLTPRSRAEVDARQRCLPRPLREFGSGGVEERLIGPEQTPCFGVTRLRLSGPVVLEDTTPRIGIVTRGRVLARAGGERHSLSLYDKVLIPAGLGRLELAPEAATAELLLCHPPS